MSNFSRLFVGVLSDDSVAAYKRAPVMTMEERANAVRTCKYVHKVRFSVAAQCILKDPQVIENPPAKGIPEEFIKKHNIHVVCLSPEYDTVQHSHSSFCCY